MGNRSRCPASSFWMVRPALMAVLTLSAQTAKADWQYTRWGMTPDQVITASSGKAKRLDPAFMATHPDASPVMGSYRLQSGETASVSFDFQSNQLVKVSLNGFSDYGTNLPVLLRQTYGAPIFQEISSAGCKTNTTEWRSEGSNQHIQLTETQCGSGYAMRAINYRPIFAPNQGGL